MLISELKQLVLIIFNKILFALLDYRVTFHLKTQPLTFYALGVFFIQLPVFFEGPPIGGLVSIPFG